jgi:hypothetical protein
MHTAQTPPILIQGPITRVRVGQLPQQVSSFLSTRAYSCEDDMLSKDIIDYIVLRNFGDDHEGLWDQQGPGGKQGGCSSQDEGPNSIRIRLPQPPGAGFIKIIAQATNGLQFQ